MLEPPPLPPPCPLGGGAAHEAEVRDRMVIWPLTPRSLNVQTALIARFGSAHSGGKRGSKSSEAAREPLGRTSFKRAYMGPKTLPWNQAATAQQGAAVTSKPTPGEPWDGVGTHQRSLLPGHRPVKTGTTSLSRPSLQERLDLSFGTEPHPQHC